MQRSAGLRGLHRIAPAAGQTRPARRRLSPCRPTARSLLLGGRQRRLRRHACEANAAALKVAVWGDAAAHRRHHSRDALAHWQRIAAQADARALVLQHQPGVGVWVGRCVGELNRAQEGRAGRGGAAASPLRTGLRAA